MKAAHVKLGDYSATLDRGTGPVPLLNATGKRRGDVRFSSVGEIVVLNGHVKSFEPTIGGPLSVIDHDTGSLVMNANVAIHDATFYPVFTEPLRRVAPDFPTWPYLKRMIDVLHHDIPWHKWLDFATIPGGGELEPDAGGSSRMVYSHTPLVMAFLLDPDPDHLPTYEGAIRNFLFAEAARAVSYFTEKGPWVALTDPTATNGQVYKGKGGFILGLHASTTAHGRTAYMDGSTLKGNPSAGLKPANDLHLAGQQFVDIAAATGSEVALMLAWATLESAASRQQFRSGEAMNSGHNIRGAGWFLQLAGCLKEAFGWTGKLDHLNAYAAHVLDSWDKTSGAAGNPPRTWTALTKQQDDHLRPTAAFDAWCAKVKADFGVTIDPKEALRYQSGPMSFLTLHGFLRAKEAGLFAGREAQAQRHEDALANWCFRVHRFMSREIDSMEFSLPSVKNKAPHLPDVRTADDVAPLYNIRSNPWHDRVVGWFADAIPACAERLARHRPSEAHEILPAADEVYDYCRAAGYWGKRGPHYRGLESMAATFARRGWPGVD